LATGNSLRNSRHREGKNLRKGAPRNTFLTKSRNLLDTRESYKEREAEKGKRIRKSLQESGKRGKTYSA